MADSLHTRYMAASDAWRIHRKGCEPCQIKQPCETGAPLFERLTRLQDAYLNHLRNH
ncbi:hypothetical protein [Streptomyces sp. NBC_01643]|uniref:hypothetical protein n=1 Tax=Streptomyces sp. NBC_01643 TaxID=2975906 RepID=UPI002F90EAE5|nr:hypothetical protein OHB03_49115 [Streptomyces sp. NBC_01643]